MKAVITKKTILTISILIAGMGLMLSVLSFYFMQDKVLTTQVRRQLQKAMQSTGLRVDINQLKWLGWGNFTCSRLILTDSITGWQPLTAEKVNIQVDPFQLFKNPSHPETLIKRVDIFGSTLKITRYANGTLDIQRYIPKSKRKLALQAVFRIRDGLVDWHDNQYGHHSIKKVNGIIDFSENSTIVCNISGAADLNDRFHWQLQGVYKIDKNSGNGLFQADNILLSKISAFLPPRYRYPVKSGMANVAANFSWSGKKFWIKNGELALSKTRIVLPRVGDGMMIEDLVADFYPDHFNLKSARLNYKGALIKADGRININDRTIKLRVSADRIRLEELAQLDPRSRQYGIKGLSNVKLMLGGTLSHPMINGDIAINNTTAVFPRGIAVSGISGRIQIKQNNVLIHRLEGNWEKSSLLVTGTIQDLFHPQLALKISGSGLTSDYRILGFPQLKEFDILGKIDFSGEITGGLKRFNLSGQVEADRIIYQNIAADNVRLNLAWESGARNLKIQQISSDLWGGKVDARGEIKIGSEEVQWLITGNATNINLNKTILSPQSEINGLVSMDLLMRGTWRRGQKFEPGTMLGVVKGNSLGYQGFYIKEANGIFSWNNNQWSIDSLQGKIGEGHFFGHIIGEKDQFRGDLNVESVKLRSLLPEQKKYPLDGEFSGSFNFQGPFRSLTGNIKGDFANIVWNSKPMGDLKGEIRYINRGLETSDLKAYTKSGDFALSGRVNWQAEPALNLRISSEKVRLQDFWQLLPINSSLRIDGTGKVAVEVQGSLANPKYQGQIQLNDLQFQKIRMERGEIAFEGDREKIVFQKFNLMDHNTVVRISGEVSSEVLDLQVATEQFNLQLLQLDYNSKVLHGTVNLTGKISGKITNPVFSARLHGTDFSFGSYNYRSFNADIVWNGQGLDIKEAQLNKDSSLLNIYGRIENTKPLKLNLGVKINSCDIQELLRLTQFGTVDVEGKLSGLIRITGTVNDPVIRMIGDISQASFNDIPITGEIDLSYTRNKIIIDKIQLEHGTGSLVANGIWEGGQILRLKTLLRNFPLQVLNPFIKSTYKLEGIANSEISLEWSNTKISGDYRVNITGLNINQNFVGDLRVGGEFSDQGLEITEGLLMNKTGLAIAKGYMPWPVEPLRKLKLPIKLGKDYRSIDMSVGLRNLPTDSINFISKLYSSSKGLLNGDVQLKGELLHPDIYGKINGSSVKVTIFILPRTVENSDISMVFNGNKAAIESSGIYGTDGKFSLNGSATLNNLFNPDFNLTFTGKRIYYRNQYFDGFGNLDVTLVGKLTQPLIHGDITVNNCKMGILSIQPRKKGKIWNPTLDVNIKTGRNSRYRQYGLADVEVEGGIQIKGPVLNSIINGEAKSKAGVLTLYGQSFKVDRGIAVFKNSEGFLPYIDVDSSLKTSFKTSFNTSKVDVFLGIKGQIGGNITFSLTSQPYLSQSELFSVLNWSELKGDKSLTLNGMVTGNITVVTDTLFGEVFFEIRKALRVDYLYLEHDYQEKNFRINMGDYLTEDLFLSYSRSVSNEPQETWGLEYQLTPKLLVGGAYSLEDGSTAQLVYRIRF